MIYASSKGFLKNTLDGIAVDIEVTELSEISLDVLRKRVREGLTRR
jgi:hypothetical protein